MHVKQYQQASFFTSFAYMHVSKFKRKHIIQKLQVAPPMCCNCPGSKESINLYSTAVQLSINWDIAVCQPGSAKWHLVEATYIVRGVQTCGRHAVQVSYTVLMMSFNPVEHDALPLKKLLNSSQARANTLLASCSEKIKLLYCCSTHTCVQQAHAAACTALRRELHASQTTCCTIRHRARAQARDRSDPHATIT
jgi:hypothetical protein